SRLTKRCVISSNRREHILLQEIPHSRSRVLNALPRRINNPTESLRTLIRRHKRRHKAHKSHNDNADRVKVQNNIQRRLRRGKSGGNSAHNPHRDLIRFPRSNNRTDTSRDRNEPALVFLQPMSSILQRRNYRVLYVVEGCLACVTYALNNVSESSTSAFATFELLNKRLYCVGGLANPVTYNHTPPPERRLQSLQPVRDTVHGILERLLQRTEHSRTGTSKIRTQVVQRPTGSVPRFLCSAAQVFFHCRREQL